MKLVIEFEFDGQYWGAQIASNDLGFPLEYVHDGGGSTVSEALEDLLNQVRDELDNSGKQAEDDE